MNVRDDAYLAYLDAKEKAAKTALKLAALESQIEKTRRADEAAQKAACEAFDLWCEICREERLAMDGAS